MLCLAQSTTDATQVRIVSVDAGSCGPGEFAAFSQAEVTQALGNPFYLDAASAISISQAILLVWAVAWLQPAR